MTAIPRRDFLCQALAVCGSALVAPGPLAHRLADTLRRQRGAGRSAA